MCIKKLFPYILYLFTEDDHKERFAASAVAKGNELMRNPILLCNIRYS